MMMMSDLPANVTPAPDRHGKMRYRFRRKGWKSAYLQGEPGSAEFHASLAQILAGGKVERQPAESPRAVKPRSLDDLLARHRKSVKWRKKGDRTRLVQGRILDRFMDRTSKKGLRYGVRPVADAIEVAGCPNREGPFGGYDYGHNTDFYGPAPDAGRYVVRDFRDPSSPDWGKFMHLTNDREEHELVFAQLTRRHIAKAAIRVTLSHMGEK
jgi:hypothetical protein